MPVVGLLPIVMMGGAVLFGVAKYKEKIDGAWSRAGDDLGLSVTTGGVFSSPRLEGTIDGVGVVVRVRNSGGDNNQNYTRYEVRHRPVGPPVTLKRQGGFTRIAKFFGKRDVEIGDPFFDDKVVIDSAHETAIRDFLTPARQAVVLEVFDRWHRGEIRHDTIIAETNKIETDPRALATTVRRLVAMAEVMGSPDAVDAALSMRNDGNIADAAAALHELNQEQPNLFTETLEAEALIELGDHRAAVRVFDIVDERLPPPPVAAPEDGWKVLASKPAPVTLPAPPRTVASLATPLQAVIDDLFDSGRLSYEIVEHFEQQYANQTVQWSGTVTRFSAYRHDRDFRNGSGVKAVVLLGTAGLSRAISNQVHAVVNFPPDTHLERGGDVRFGGTLVRIDRFARKLYVDHAQLVEG